VIPSKVPTEQARTWAWEGGNGVTSPLDSENFSKKGGFLSLEREKPNFNTFSAPLEKFWKKLVSPSGKNSSDAHAPEHLLMKPMIRKKCGR